MLWEENDYPLSTPHSSLEDCKKVNGTDKKKKNTPIFLHYKYNAWFFLKYVYTYMALNTANLKKDRPTRLCAILK